MAKPFQVRVVFDNKITEVYELHKSEKGVGSRLINKGSNVRNRAFAFNVIDNYMWKSRDVVQDGHRIIYNLSA